MKYKIVYLFLFLFSAMLVFAQEEQGYSNMESTHLYRNHKMKAGEWKNIMGIDEYEGSPYLNDEFISGDIITELRNFVNVPLRFNIYSDEIEFKTVKNEIRALSNSEGIKKVIIGETELVYLPFLNGKKVKEGYFKIIKEGDASLYARFQVSFTEATKPTDQYMKEQPPSFHSKPETYYIKIGTNLATKVTKKRAELVSIFPRFKKEVENFAKKNKVKFKDQDSLIKLVEFYNSLQ